MLSPSLYPRFEHCSRIRLYTFIVEQPPPMFVLVTRAGNMYSSKLESDRERKKKKQNPQREGRKAESGEDRPC